MDGDKQVVVAFVRIRHTLTGRSYDGENYNIGFVSVTDTPHPEIVQAARTIHDQMYHRRWTHSPHTTRPGTP
jgi:agarase